MMTPAIGSSVLVYRHKTDVDPMIGIVVGGFPATHGQINVIYWNHYTRDLWRQQDAVPFDENEDPNGHGFFWRRRSTDGKEGKKA
jgi:hypothetical protein